MFPPCAGMILIMTMLEQQYVILSPACGDDPYKYRGVPVLQALFSPMRGDSPTSNVVVFSVVRSFPHDSLTVLPDAWGNCSFHRIWG